MKIIKNIGAAGIFFLFAVLLSCSIPFTVETAKAEITLSNTYGLTVEEAVGVPDDALRQEITYNRIVINYTATANTNFISDVDVNLYISDETTADNSKASDDEDILIKTLSPGETVSGTTESEKLKTILNARQETFILGGDVSGISPPAGAEVTIEMYAVIEGSYSLSP